MSAAASCSSSCGPGCNATSSTSDAIRGCASGVSSRGCRITSGVNSHGCKITSDVSSHGCRAPSDVSRLYMMLVVLRFVLAPLQTSYLHPDEFLQSLEPVAGRLLDVNVTLAWEFRPDEASPPRSWAALLLTVGPAALLAGATSSGTVLLTAARLWMALLSLCVDAAVCSMARLLRRPARACLETLASSHVMLVFAPRTLSNSLELVMTALLLYVALTTGASRARAADAELRLRARLQSDYAAHRLRLAEAAADTRRAQLSCCGSVAALLSVGVFVRPTFAAFAAPSLLYWLLSGAGDGTEDWLGARLRRLVPLTMLCSAAVVLLDSLMYGRLTVADMIEGTFSLECLVVTPLNFVLYNTQSEKLAVHGTHWRGTHALLHAPLLFSVLAVLAAFTLFRRLGPLLRHLLLLDLPLSSPAALLWASVLVPLAALSWFPHQEARFLVPLLVPLVLLHAPRLHAAGRRARLLRAIYTACSVAGVLALGFMQQGGVTRALLHLRQEVSAGGTLVFWQTYPAPQSLLLRRRRDTALYDLAGAPASALLEPLRVATYRQRAPAFLVAPAPLQSRLTAALEAEFSLTEQRRLWPHASAEAPPQLAKLAIECQGRLLCLVASVSEQLQLVVWRVRRRPPAVGRPGTSGAPAAAADETPPG